MSAKDLVELWNEDVLEPRYGVVTEIARRPQDGSYWIHVKGCVPRLDDAICIIGTTEEKV